MVFRLPEQAAVREGLADTPGARLWYWDTGGSGEPVVLSHPLSQGCAIWAHQQPVFAAAGYRIVAYSRRGVDRSERGTDADPGTAIGACCHLLDALDIEQAHVIGGAAGGGMAVAHTAGASARATA